MSFDVSRLPTRTLTPGTTLQRIHRATNDPWYFDSSDRGRFNPVGRSGWGACYWAESQLGAFVEVFRTRLRLVESDISDRVLTTLTVADSMEVADLTTRMGLAAGVAADLVHGADYGPAQHLASQIVGRHGGVQWRVRHDLEQALVGVALFGRPGHVPNDKLLTQPLPEALQEDASRNFGYEVLPALTDR